MSARSGLRKRLPTRGRWPPRRNSLRVAAERAEALPLSRGLVVEGLVDDEAGAGQRAPPGAGSAPGERVPHRSSARFQVARVPGVPTETPLVTRFGEERVVGLAGVRVDEGVARHRARRGLAAVDRADPAGPRVVVDEVAAAADAGAVRLGHARGRPRWRSPRRSRCRRAGAPAGRSGWRRRRPRSPRRRTRPRSAAWPAAPPGAQVAAAAAAAERDGDEGRGGGAEGQDGGGGGGAGTTHGEPSREW